MDLISSKLSIQRFLKHHVGFYQKMNFEEKYLLVKFTNCPFSKHYFLCQTHTSEMLLL